MGIDEVINIFISRTLNIKNNNYIFTNVSDMGFLKQIPSICQIDFDKTALDFNIREALNIKIDLNQIKIKDILEYVLTYIENCLNIEDKRSKIEFNNKFDLLKFQGKLRDLNVVVQLIVYNLDSLTMEEQMLLNEIYYFYSDYFNISAFIVDNYFQTHFLTSNRVLDNRENYTKIRVIEPRLQLVRNKKI